jgi:TolB-like protein
LTPALGGLDMSDKSIEINLFGACQVRSVQLAGFELSGAKHKALFALLVTAPFGRRTRSFLQETLWGTACYDTGRQSLRRALADIKQIMGDSYREVLTSTNSDVTVDLSRVAFIGRPGSAPLLEGLDIREKGFESWITALRQNAGQLDSLFSLVSQPALRPVLPIIAVLPFRAVGAGMEEAVLGDWLAEETCRSLSRSRLLAVISHLSCRELSQGIIDISGIRTRLGADYCIVGTVRPLAGSLVLDADFVDTRTSQILWTRQFSAPVKHFMAQSAEGISAIVRAAGSAIADSAMDHVSNRPLADVEDHRLIVAGVKLMHRSTLQDFARSRELIEEAIRRAPRTAEAHAWLGKWHVLSVFNGWSTDNSNDTRRAKDSTARALDLSSDNAFCLTIDGFVHNNLLRRLDIASQRYNAALAHNPNEALSWLLKGALHTFRDEGSQAVAASEVARSLSPIDPFGYYFDAHTAGAYICTGDYQRAFDLADAAYQKNDRHLSTLRIKLFAAHYMNKTDLEKNIAREIMRRQPDFTVSNYMNTHPSAGHDMGRRMKDALISAGIPLGE